MATRQHTEGQIMWNKIKYLASLTITTREKSLFLLGASVGTIYFNFENGLLLLFGAAIFAAIAIVKTKRKKAS
ncbi:MAG: hypothetical protein LBT37_05030 [Lactobacillaceae bacterium]|jgi:hypothetical protein|nr:hypothetical protein [Lactobacillaceae bacterium]